MVATKDDDIVKEALDRYKTAETADIDNRRRAVEDIRFVHNDDGQWTEEAKEKRKGRPCMTFDRTSGSLDQVLGDFLQNRPGIKLRGIDGEADQKLTDIYTGLIRNIESSSKSKAAYRSAFKFAVSGGYGVWRVTTDYESDTSFNQCISIKKVANPFTVKFDPSATETTKEDGNFCFVDEMMSTEEFKARHPNAEYTAGDNETIGTQHEGWFLDGKVRVCEYWRKKPHKKTICLLSDGRVVDKEEVEKIIPELLELGVDVENEREVDSHIIEWFKITGKEILERGEWAGKYFPLIPVYGKSINIEGEEHYRGLVRKAKDPQRSYNMHRSQMIETLALQPKAPYLYTPKMIEGHETAWANINTSNAPGIPYNPDPSAPGGRPTREPPPTFPAGYAQEGLTAQDDIKAATGIFDASLGARSNETSGRAIRARQLEGDTANFEFTANFEESLELQGMILVDLIPKIYDTKRVIRILGEDSAESYETINQVVLDLETGEPVKVNDLSQGKYDVAVDTGPSYSTRRVETSEQLTEVMKFNPSLGQMLSDLWIKSLDLVGGDEAIKRVRKLMITQGLVEPTEEEAQQMPQQEPNPMEEMAMRLELAQKQADVDNKNADTAKKLAETEVKEVDAAMKELELALQTQDQQAQQFALLQVLQLLAQQNQQVQPLQIFPTGGVAPGF